MERIVKGIWIPIEIWQDRSLSWNEKILLMEIDSFTAKGHECYISNDYIAELLGVSVRWAIKCLSHLIETGYIRVVKFDGRKRYVESTIQFNADMNKSSMQSGTKVQHTDNNEYINNNSLYKERTPKFQKPTIEEIRKYCQESRLDVDAEQFFNFYESKGWVIGKSPMKSWKAAVCTWSRRQKETPQRKRSPLTRSESVFEHNLKVMDKLFGTDLHDKAYGGQADEQ